MNFKPLNKRILVKAEEAKEKSDGGLYIPDMAKEKPAKGEVIARADDCDNIIIGQNVLYGKYAGTSVKIEDEMYVLIQEKEIYGIFE
jgi:chaperonin GroES